jgi:hypothetical protein
LVVELLYQREPTEKPWVLSLVVVGSTVSWWVERAWKFRLMARPPGPVGCEEDEPGRDYIKLLKTIATESGGIFRHVKESDL